MLYASVGLLLAAASVLVIVGTASGLVREIHHGSSAVDVEFGVLGLLVPALTSAVLLVSRSRPVPGA